MKTLLCVGGPMDGKYLAVHGYGDTVILPTAQPFSVYPAQLDSPKAPPMSVTMETALYKRTKIAASWPGGQMVQEVLAYYGRDRRDRPEGFYV